MIIELITANQDLLVTVGLFSALVFVLSLASLPWLVAQIPDDYFAQQKRHPQRKTKRFPGLWLLVAVIKNTLGGLLLFAGFIMLFLPGQGILTMVAGLMMMNYPGKYALERRIALSPSIFSKLNWLRHKANKPPLQR